MDLFTITTTCKKNMGQALAILIFRDQLNYILPVHKPALFNEWYKGVRKYETRKRKIRQIEGL